MSSTAHARTPTPNMSNTSAKQRPAANGATPRNKSVNEPRSPMRDMTSSDKLAHERLLFLIANMVGNAVNITVRNGEQYTGVLSGASLAKDNVDVPSFVLKMTRKIDAVSGQANGEVNDADAYVGYGGDHVMTFGQKDLSDISVSELSLDKLSAKNNTNGAAAGFKTDTDISGNTSTRERELQAWEPTGGASNVDMSLNGGVNRSWDQFETNERLYGVKTDYNEHFYTTAIDRSAPSYRDRAAAAERLAREIEGTTSSNPHVAEERNQKPQAGETLDEEDRFSGVKRDSPALISGQSNRYQPPAKRAPTAAPTVVGAPFDPAIISSQLARPDSANPNKPAMETAQNASNIADKGPALPKATTSAAKETSAVLAAISPKADSAARQAGASQTTAVATQNIARDVADAFKSFTAHEKLKIATKQTELATKQKMTAQKEREFKLNDLKKFASNFKLKTAVPQDMLGILAKDKTKQNEIIEKSKRQLEEQKSSQPTTPSASGKTAGTGISTTAANPLSPSSGPRSAHPTPLQSVPQSARTDRTVPPSAGGVVSPRASPGNLGQRLMAQQQQLQQQYRDRQPMQHVPPPSVVPTSRHGSVASVSTAGPARFNVQAMEFRPNPAAVAFAPTINRASISSPDKDKQHPIPQVKPTNRASFFGDKRPDFNVPKKKIREAFNPLPRLKKEAEELAKTQIGKKKDDFVANGGIPQGFRTPPTWDTTEENRDKTYLDMVPGMQSQNSASTADGLNAHHHQLPLHLQGMQGPQPGQQMHNIPTPLQLQGRDHRFDEHRMQFSPSQTGSYPSPRMPNVMPYANGQMMSPMQGQFVQPYTVGPNGQPIPFRPYPGNGQFIGSPGAHFAPPMGMTNSNMGVYAISPQMHGMPSPAQGHGGPSFFQPHGAGPHGYPSPRATAPMMMQQGSQQGHGPNQFMYMQPGPGQMYPGHQQPGPHMRPGVPMMHQNSHNNNVPPHFQRQFSHGANGGFNNHQGQGPPPQSPMAAPPQVMPQAATPQPVPDTPSEVKP